MLFYNWLHFFHDQKLFFEIFHLLGLQILDHFNSAIEFGRHKSPNPADAQVSFFFPHPFVFMTKKQKKNSEGSDISNSSIDFVAWKCPGLVLFQKKIASPGIYTEAIITIITIIVVVVVV